MDSGKLFSPEPKSPSFSPISVSQSPVTRIQGNLTGTVRQIRDYVADLYNLNQKWNNLFFKGIPLIQEIVDLKISSLETGIDNIYPKGLQEKNDELDLIYYNMTSVVASMKNIKELFKGIRKFEETRKNCEGPLFITWPVSKFESESELIAKAYEDELKIKKHVKENISHCTSQNELNSFLTLWVQQCFVDSQINFSLEAMLKETGHR